MDKKYSLSLQGKIGRVKYSHCILPSTRIIAAYPGKRIFAKNTYRGVAFIANSLLFLVGTQFVSVILILIGILSVLSNPDITVVLTTTLNVMSSRNPFILVPAVLLSLFSFLHYLFFFIGWFFVVYGENEISSGFPDCIRTGSIFAFFYLIIYLIRVSVSLFSLAGFGHLLYIQEIFVGSGLLFNIIDGILLSLSLLYFGKA
ncbi:MAG: hypothetical protein QXJ27_08050, partial [Thermoplasmata archaeon]